MQELITRAELDQLGWTAHNLSTAMRTGELKRLRRGYYSGADDRTRQVILATKDACSPEAVLSHATAAWLHGLPVRRAAMDSVHVTRSRRGGGRADPGVHVYACPLRPDEVQLIGELPVTTVARTVVDLGRHEPLGWAIATGDAALRAAASAEELTDQISTQLHRAVHRPGLRRARFAAGFLDARSESPGESLSRLLMHEGGLPRPELQVELKSWDEDVRVDYLWPEFGLIGEFDGAVKYGIDISGPDPTAALMKEKRREDGLRAHGYVVVRWTWDDLRVKGRLAHLIQTGLDTARRAVGVASHTAELFASRIRDAKSATVCKETPAVLGRRPVSDGVGSGA